jgi:outer membrane lipoprotein-sorting protein
MRRPLNGKLAAVVCLLLAFDTSCLVRRRLVTRQGKHDTRPLLTATKEDLVQRIRAAFQPIRSFTVTLDMTPSLGSVYKGEISEFPSVRGYVIFRKPDDIRIIGLDPVIHSRAFDMVSTGNEFHLSLPSKNLFIEGRNDAPPNPKNKLENLRPAAFLQAMLIQPPDPATEAPVIEDDTDEEHAFFVLLILRTLPEPMVVNRAVYFDRLTLQIVRQKAFDAKGLTVSDTRYSNWKNFSGVAFPSSIDINRPEDGYGVVMQLVNMKMNNEVTDDKFVLAKPEGAQLKVIGEAAGK